MSKSDVGYHSTSQSPAYDVVEDIHSRLDVPRIVIICTSTYAHSTVLEKSERRDWIKQKLMKTDPCLLLLLLQYDIIPDKYSSFGIFRSALGFNY